MKYIQYLKIKFFKIILSSLFIFNYLARNIIYKNYIINNNISVINQIKLDYKNNIFAILMYKCKTCGLFSFYNYYLGCINKYLLSGYIPIIDLTSSPNIFNGLNNNSLNNNPWELYFNQPFGYTLENIKKYANAKNIKYVQCNLQKYEKPNDSSLYINKVLMNFWNSLSFKYIPIKNDIIKQANIVKKKLFNYSNNVLGVLVRGTDYIALKPRGHSRQPKLDTVFKDIKQMDTNNKYDYIFLTTEDDLIRLKFLKVFGIKLKYFKFHKNIDYNYKKKSFLGFNKNINSDFMKIYIINIIILSKCIDIICSRCNGSRAAFIFSNGFRYQKVYYLGDY